MTLSEIVRELDEITRQFYIGHQLSAPDVEQLELVNRAIQLMREITLATDPSSDDYRDFRDALGGMLSERKRLMRSMGKY